MIFLLFAIVPAKTAFAETMILKHNFAAGLQFAYLDLNSDNSELFLIVSPISANGSIFHLTPVVEYAYKNDCAIGGKIQYMSGNATLDNLSLDLMSEGLQFSVSDISSRMKRFSGIIYHRNYFALDKHSRIGVIAEESLTYSRSYIDYDSDAPGTRYSTGNRFTLAFSPGITFFVMNSISIGLSVSMANLSYNSVKSYKAGEEPGSRTKFGAKFGVDVTGVNFEIVFHF